MSIRDIIQDDLRSIERELGNQTFRWSNVDYICAPASVETMLELEEGGFKQNFSLILKARQELFNGVFPESRDVIVFGGESYRIENVRKDPFSSMIVLTCVSINAGA
jgi:hypothetical protein